MDSMYKGRDEDSALLRGAVGFALSLVGGPFSEVEEEALFDARAL